MKVHLIILRGPQGSGKSTFCNDFSKLLSPKEVSYTFSADLNMTDSKGNYHFDAAKLPAAHQKCYADAKSTLEFVRQDWLSMVAAYLFVDNTNCEAWEYAPYIAEAIFHKTDSITIVTCAGQFQNVHGVSDKQVEAKRRQFQYARIPSHWTKDYTAPSNEPQAVYSHINKIKTAEA
jgi:hypothetical protein